MTSQTRSSENSSRSFLMKERSLEVMTDTIPLILSFLDVEELCRASCVSRTWNFLAQNDEYWERLCIKRFGLSSRGFRPPPNPTKVLYILTHVNFKRTCGPKLSSNDAFTGMRRQNFPSLPRVELSNFLQ